MVIGRALLLMAFERDVDFLDVYPQSTYLDRRSGKVDWLHDNDDAHLLVAVLALPLALHSRRLCLTGGWMR